MPIVGLVDDGLRSHVPSRSASSALRRWLFSAHGAVFACSLGFALCLTLGIPLWDDDFVSWLRQAQAKSVPHILWEIVSPISTQPQYWGFNERPIETLCYKLCFMISGYASWSNWLLKSLTFAAMTTMLYDWCQHLAPRPTAIVVTVFFAVSPGTLAALFWLPDFAPMAEFAFLALTWWILFRSETASQRSLYVLAICTVLSYKIKADLKLIPAILGVHLLVTRAHWRRWTGPLCVMLLGAVPWGPGIFQHAPPFVPGSHGSEIGWMWQPASLSRLVDFFRPLTTRWDEPTLSLPPLWLPFAAVGLAAGWMADRKRSRPDEELHDVAPAVPIFILIWLAAALIAISALPALNYTYRIRYAIIPMVPLTLLTAWVAGRLRSRAAIIVLGLAVAAQSAINLDRSLNHCATLRHVMIAVDRVHAWIAENAPAARVTRLSDFLPYDYHPDGPANILRREQLDSLDKLSQYPVGQTYVISWQPSLDQRLDLVAVFDGAASDNLAGRLFPDTVPFTACLMRYVGNDPRVIEALDHDRAHDYAAARPLYEAVLRDHPGNLAVKFWLARDDFELKNYATAESIDAELQRLLPDQPVVLYNHALALEALQRPAAAISLLRRVQRMWPNNAGVKWHLKACGAQP